MKDRASAKINLCLYLGPLRPDGYHELLSIFQSISLFDELELTDHDGQHDEVRCPGLEGPNIAERAIAMFREATGWDGPPQLLQIEKRIPIAAGLGGGSADAAATLRLLTQRSGLTSDLHPLSTRLGADVPSQLSPGRYLVEGIGDRLTRLPAPGPLGIVILPCDAQLSTADVYREADRQGLTRTRGELERIRATLDLRSPEHVNDLAQAARALEPAIDALIARLSIEGVAGKLTGSGPTVFALFPTLQDAQGVTDRLVSAGVAAHACVPIHNSSLT